MNLPRLHVVTDDDILARSDFLDAAGALLSAHGGAVALHVRGRGMSARRLLAIAAALAPVAADAGSILLVNDRIDIAVAACAQGIHLGERSIPPADARRLVGDRLLGRSIHAPEGAEAVACWTDFLFLGTIYRTPSHPEATPLGPAALAELDVRIGVPTLAIGGVTPGHVPELLRAGAYGVAVIGGVWTRGDPVENAETYLGAIRDGEEGSRSRGVS